MFLFTATGIPNGDAAQAALQQAYPTIPYPGIGKFNYFNQGHLALFFDPLMLHISNYTYSNSVFEFYRLLHIWS